MPVYTYTCTACGETVERRQSFSDAPLTTCEACGGALRKVFHPVGIVFKGSGWYVTDSRSATNGTATTTATNGAADSANGKDGAASTPAADGASGNGKAEPAPAAPAPAAETSV